MPTMTTKSRGTLPVGKSNLNCCLIAVTVVLLGLSSVYADTVYVDSSYFEGERSSDPNGGVTATGSWANGGFEVSWEIEYEDGIYEYEYEFEISGTDYGSIIDALSQWILQLADVDLSSIEVEYDDDEIEFEFETSLAPVWGSFYIADGDTLYAYNTGYGGMPDPNGPFTGFIATPDGYLGTQSVPEPSTLILLLSGMGVLAGAARFRKKT